MTKRRIVSTITDAWGNALAIYDSGDGYYGVATLSSHLAVIPLADALYETYGAAQERREHEWQQRRVTAQHEEGNTP